MIWLIQLTMRAEQCCDEGELGELNYKCRKFYFKEEKESENGKENISECEKESEFGRRKKNNLFEEFTKCFSQSYELSEKNIDSIQTEAKGLILFVDKIISYSYGAKLNRYNPDQYTKPFPPYFSFCLFDNIQQREYVYVYYIQILMGNNGFSF